jgi:hypothetical protein
LTVLNNQDSGPGSLRDTIGAAASADTIDFDPSLAGQVVTLTSGQLLLNKSLDIKGLGADQLTISGNHGIRVFDVPAGATVSISGLTIANGGEEGGGIDNGGTLTLNNCTVTGNVSPVSSTGFSAGGILNTGNLTVSNCTISANTGGDAGGIVNYHARLTVNNSTIAGDMTYPTIHAAGGVVLNGGTVTITGSTISGNSAMRNDFVGGVRILVGIVTIGNSIIAGNTGSDIAGSFTSAGYNLIGGNPLLGPLQDNGGATQTMAVLPGSPALNAGDPAQLGSSDQRGVVRTGAVNIGAYQASATAFMLNAPDTVQAGVPFDLTVTAVDPYGQVALGYIGTVTFSTTDPDPGVVLPTDYTFTSADQGSVRFSGGVTLITPGDQTLCVTDTADATIAGAALVFVSNQ